IADTFYNPLNQPLCPWVVDISKTKGIELCDGARAHGEYIAIDSAYPCGSALIRLQRRRVVMGFDFKGASQAISDINQPRIFFSGLGQHVRSILWQCL